MYSGWYNKLERIILLVIAQCMTEFGVSSGLEQDIQDEQAEVTYGTLPFISGLKYLSFWPLMLYFAAFMFYFAFGAQSPADRLSNHVMYLILRYPDSKLTSLSRPIAPTNQDDHFS